MGLRLVTPSAADPITLAELRAHCRQDLTDDDADLTQYLREATDEVQSQCGRQIVDARYRLMLAQFPAAAPIKLPRAPAAAVESIRYRDLDGEWQTWATGRWAADCTTEPGEIRPAYSLAWPASRGFAGDVEITYWAGCASPVTAMSAGDDTITVTGAPVVDDDELVLWSPGDLPTGLSRGQTYYSLGVVTSGDRSVMQLAESAGGAAVALSGSLTAGGLWLVRAPREFQAARAAIKLMAANKYEAREATSSEQLREIPLGVSRLIEQLQWGAEYVRAD